MSPRSRRRGVALSLALSVLLAACSTPAATPSSAPSITPAPPPTTEPSPSPVAAFPVTLTDDEGTEVELAAEPQVIVSLTPATTEILFELGAGDRVVATDDGDRLPGSGRRAPRRRDVLERRRRAGGRTLNRISSSPAAWASRPADAITQLRALDIPVLVLYAPSVEGVYKDIELIGTATGTSEAAVALTSGMRAEIEAISDAVAASGTPPRVFYEIGYDATTGAIFAPAADSFVAEMVTLAGGDTITTGDPNTYEIALEKLIEQRPGGHRPRGQPVLHADPRRSRGSPRLEGHDRRRQRRRPDRPRYRDHPTRTAAAARACATSPTTIRPDVTLPAAP